MDTLLDKRLRELEEVRRKVLMGGGEEKVRQHHGLGKLTARERVSQLLDPDSFFEFNMLVGHAVDLPGDGIVCGCGTIYGRPVYVFSQDATVRGGSIGFEHGRKMYETIERAIDKKVPVIGLNDSPGARLPNAYEVEMLGSMKRSLFAGLQEKHGGSVFYPNTLGSGLIPQISAILGTCGGISVYSPALTDFIYMVDGISHMFITGPDVVRMVTGENISKDDLGGAKVHAQKSGVCDFRCASEHECLAEIRRLISFLPLNCEEKPPVYQSTDSPNRSCDELNEVVPSSPNKPYDVHRIIHAIVDSGDFLEVKKEFACEVVVGFGRLDGKTIGIVANQPSVMAGAMTFNSSDKQARFIRFCDCFNIPILLLVDTPAYMPGSGQEHSGIIRHGAKVLYALCEALVPRICVVLRKAYGGGNLGMGVLPGLSTDIVVYWPTVETGILGAEQSVNLLYGRRKDVTKEFLQEKLQAYRETYANPIYDVSSNLGVHDVIAPAETRSYLIRAFQALPEMRESRVRKMNKRHGNIPL
jgi:acetyl-CoA carboxylase carboxyltransferase component